MISRTTYASLWALASAAAVSEAAWATDKGKFSNGDGSTTFRLPDLRDQFIRGAGASRVVGTSQLDAFQGHYHSSGGYYGTTGGGNLLLGGINSGTVAISGPITDGTNGTPRTAAETRPVNVAVNYIIRALA